MPFLINQAILTFIYHKAASITAKSKIPSESFHIMSCQMKFLMQIATESKQSYVRRIFISNSTTATQRTAEVQNDTARHILYDKSGRQTHRHHRREYSAAVKSAHGKKIYKSHRQRNSRKILRALSGENHGKQCREHAESRSREMNENFPHITKAREIKGDERAACLQPEPPAPDPAQLCRKNMPKLVNDGGS